MFYDQDFIEWHRTKHCHFNLHEPGAVLRYRGYVTMVTLPWLRYRGYVTMVMLPWLHYVLEVTMAWFRKTMALS